MHLQCKRSLACIWKGEVFFHTQTAQVNKLYVFRGQEMVVLHFAKIVLSFYTPWLKFVYK